MPQDVTSQHDPRDDEPRASRVLVAKAALCVAMATVVACGDNRSSAVDEVEGSLRRLRDAGTATLSFDIRGLLSESAEAITGRGAIDFRSDRAYLTTHVPQPNGAEVVTDEVIEPSRRLVQIPPSQRNLTEGRSWVAVESMTNGPRPDIVGMLLTAEQLESATKVKRLSSGQLNAAPLSRYEVHLPVRALAAGEAVAEQFGDSNVRIELWVSQKKRVVERQIAKIEVGGTTITATLDLSKVGDEVQIPRPAKEDVFVLPAGRDLQDVIGDGPSTAGDGEGAGGFSTTSTTFTTER